MDPLREVFGSGWAYLAGIIIAAIIIAINKRL